MNKKNETPRNGESRKSESNSQVSSKSRVKSKLYINKNKSIVKCEFKHTPLIAPEDLEKPKIPFKKKSYKIEYCGNTTILTTTHKGQNGIQLLPKNESGRNEYVILSTGELKECKAPSKIRLENMRYLKNSLASLAKIVDYNIDNYKSFLVFTLTYQENMTDTKRLYKDFEKFWKRLVYTYGDKSASQYIAAAEPQARGAWHWHVILFQEKKTFLKWKDLESLWGFGFVDVDKRKKITESDSVGKYLVGYLSDFPLDELDQIKTDISRKNLIENKKLDVYTNKEGKKIIKGLRMLLYPARFRFFRWSRGIKRPPTERKKISYYDVKSFGHCVSYKEFTYLVDGEERSGERYFFKKIINPNFTPLEIENGDFNLYKKEGMKENEKDFLNKLKFSKNIIR